MREFFYYVLASKLRPFFWGALEEFCWESGRRNTVLYMWQSQCLSFQMCGWTELRASKKNRFFRHGMNHLQQREKKRDGREYLALQYACGWPCICSRHCVTLTVTDTIAARIEKSVSLARESQKRDRHVPNRGCRERRRDKADAMDLFIITISGHLTNGRLWKSESNTVYLVYYITRASSGLSARIPTAVKKLRRNAATLIASTWTNKTAALSCFILFQPRVHFLPLFFPRFSCFSFNLYSYEGSTGRHFNQSCPLSEW